MTSAPHAAGPSSTCAPWCDRPRPLGRAPATRGLCGGRRGSLSPNAPPAAAASASAAATPRRGSRNASAGASDGARVRAAGGASPRRSGEPVTPGLAARLPVAAPPREDVGRQRPQRLGLRSFVVATWLLDWATESGYFLSVFYRGPLLLPIVVIAVVLLLLWRTPGNQRPRKGRTTPLPEWRQRWRENRRLYGARGAFRPVNWGTARTLAAAVVWLLAAAAVAGNLAQIEDLTAADVGAGGWVALAATLCGFVGCLLCLPVSRRRLVQVDADGGYYGVAGPAGDRVRGRTSRTGSGRRADAARRVRGPVDGVAFPPPRPLRPASPPHRSDARERSGSCFRSHSS